MSELLCTIISFLSTIVDILAYYWLLSNKLNCRLSKKLRIIAYFIAYLFMFLAGISSNIFPGFPVNFMSLLLIYNDNLYKKLIWIISTFFTITVCEIIAMPIALFITKSNLNRVTESSNTQILGLILSRLLLFIVISGMIRFPQKLSKDLIKDFIIIMLLIPLPSHVSFISTTYI